MDPNQERRSVSGLSLVAAGVIVLAILAVVTGGGVITTSSGCQDRVSTDPEYANGANFYGLGLGFCLAD